MKKKPISERVQLALEVMKEIEVPETMSQDEMAEMIDNIDKVIQAHLSRRKLN